MKRKTTYILLILLATIFCISNIAFCDTISSYTDMDMVRGRYKAFTMSPDDISEATCYYYADGRDATLEWKEASWFFYLMGAPMVMMNIYFTWGSNRPWYQIGNSRSIDIFTQKMLLPFNQGRYKFYIKVYEDTAYGSGDPQLSVPQLLIH